MSGYERRNSGFERTNVVGSSYPRLMASGNWIMALAAMLALAFVLWIFYGALPDRFGSPASRAVQTQAAPEPYPVNPTPPSPAATTTNEPPATAKTP